MRADVGLTQLLGDPHPRRLRIGHGLDGGEGLRRDEEQRGLGLQELDRIRDVGAVDVGDVVQARAVMIGRQRQRGHRRAEVRAADADVDDVGDRRLADLARKRRHGGEHAVDVRHDVLAIDHDRRIGAVAECRMQHGTLLGGVDDGACEHVVALGLDVTGLGQCCQQFHGMAVHRALGIVEQHGICRGGELRETVGIALEGAPHVGGRALLVVGLQVSKHFAAVGLCHVSSSSGFRRLPWSRPARSSARRLRSPPRSASCPWAAASPRWRATCFRLRVCRGRRR